MENTQNPHLYSNYRKVISISEKDWHSAKSGQICELNASVKKNNYLSDQYGRELHHFCTTSYLGLDYNQETLEGAILGIREAKTLRIANSKKSMQT